MTAGSNTRADGVTDGRTVTQRFWGQREAVLEIVARHGQGDVHVLGTVTRDGDVVPTADISLVVALTPEASLTVLGKLAHEVSAASGLRVDVVTLAALGADAGAKTVPHPPRPHQGQP